MNIREHGGRFRLPPSARRGRGRDGGVAASHAATDGLVRFVAATV